MAPLLPWGGVSWDSCDQKPLKMRGSELCEVTLGARELAAALKRLQSPRIRLGKTVHYLPILFIDQLSSRVKDLTVSSQGSLGPVRGSAAQAGPQLLPRRRQRPGLWSRETRRARVVGGRSGCQGFLGEAPCRGREHSWGPTGGEGRGDAALGPGGAACVGLGSDSALPAGHQPLHHRAAPHRVLRQDLAGAAALLDPHAGRRVLTAAVR